MIHFNSSPRFDSFHSQTIGIIHQRRCIIEINIIFASRKLVVRSNREMADGTPNSNDPFLEVAPKADSAKETQTNDEVVMIPSDQCTTAAIVTTSNHLSTTNYPYDSTLSSLSKSQRKKALKRLRRQQLQQE
jgi:GTP-binding protein EngB required for normal cell division